MGPRRYRRGWHRNRDPLHIIIDASMGPRRYRRGWYGGASPRRVGVPSFNGAATLSSRMVDQVRVVETAVGFNGAATLSSRMESGLAPAPQWLAASMGPRRYRRGWPARNTA